MALTCVLAAIALVGAGAQVELSLDTTASLATTSANLASVTIDVRALKDALDFSDPLLKEYAKHLSPAVLRIGGSDQNNFRYNMSSRDPMTPCKNHKSPDCVMTAAYWDSVLSFASEANLDLVFGLTPSDIDNAKELVHYTSQQNFSRMLAWSYGNEQNGKTVPQQYLEDMKQVRKVLLADYPPSSNKRRPLLIGADTGIGPLWAGWSPTQVFEDEKHITHRLEFIKTFVSTCSSVLDAVSWHTYDYRAETIGATDHHALPFPPVGKNVSHLFDPAFHDIAGVLADNVSAIVAEAAPDRSLPVWLTETNSICHQGTWNVTNAFFNSLWLVDRLGMMANRGVQVMARQSLIGYNYSLLGNFPHEPIFAAPDYFTTLIFKRLTAETVLRVASPKERLRTYAFCSREFKGGVTVLLANLDEDEAVLAEIPLAGRYDVYSLAPASHEERPRFRATSRVLALNGEALLAGPHGEPPTMKPVQKKSSGVSEFEVEPLTFAFLVFRDTNAAPCAVPDPPAPSPAPSPTPGPPCKELDGFACTAEAHCHSDYFYSGNDDLLSCAKLCDKSNKCTCFDHATAGSSGKQPACRLTEINKVKSSKDSYVAYVRKGVPATQQTII